MTTRPGAPRGKAYYELDATRNEYLAFHYPDPRRDPLEALLGPRTPPLAERFPYAVAALVPPRPGGRALDVGAAFGRVALDLARNHRVALDIDLSGALVSAARDVAATGRARYAIQQEGEITEELDVPVDTPPNARFAVADALGLPFADRAFDTVVALNLVDRVPDPGRALDELGRVTAPRGTLVVGSPYTWLSEWTPRERWLGGFLRDGRAVRGPESVAARLGAAFRVVRDVRMPFYIPHHARSGQLGMAQVLVLEKSS